MTSATTGSPRSRRRVYVRPPRTRRKSTRYNVGLISRVSRSAPTSAIPPNPIKHHVRVRCTHQLECAIFGYPDFDLRAFPETQRLCDRSRYPNRQTVSPLGNLHATHPTIYEDTNVYLPARAIQAFRVSGTSLTRRELLGLSARRATGPTRLPAPRPASQELPEAALARDHERHNRRCPTLADAFTCIPPNKRRKSTPRNVRLVSRVSRSAFPVSRINPLVSGLALQCPESIPSEINLRDVQTRYRSDRPRTFDHAVSG